MKIPILMAALLLTGSAALPQTTGKKHVHKASCRELFIESARALPGLYARYDTDSLQYWIDQRSPCDPAMDIYAIKTLLAIQENRFSRDLLPDLFYYGMLDDYAGEVHEYKKGHGRIDYYSSRYFDATPYDKAIFGVTTAWARHLLDAGRTDSVETFLLRVFAGDVQHPEGAVKADKDKYATLYSILMGSKIRRRNNPALIGALGVGLWAPGGHASALGVHPSFDLSVGLRSKLNQIEWAISGRVLNGAADYDILRNGTLYARSHYLGGYIGIDYTRYIIHSYRFEAGLIAGAGYDGFDLAGHSKYDHDNDYLSPLSINSFNSNLGLRCHYFLDVGFALGIVAKYHFINYCNPGGTPLDGHAFSLALYLGMNSPRWLKGKEPVK